VDPEQFEDLVDEALEGLPPEFADRLDNVDVVTERRPSARTLREMGLGSRETLLGLYQGVPQTDRTSEYGGVMPDRIVIYRDPILAEATEDRRPSEALDEAIRRVIRDTVLHEIGHHFGLGDPELEGLGY